MDLYYFSSGHQISFKEKNSWYIKTKELTGGCPASEDVLTENQFKLFTILGKTFKGVGRSEGDWRIDKGFNVLCK